LLFAQTVIDAALKLERALLTVNLYREKSWCCVVFGSEDSTVDSKPNRSPSLILRLSAYL
jgi:hypothetical protein